jgi:nitrite reductase (NO-forming)
MLSYRHRCGEVENVMSEIAPDSVRAYLPVVDKVNPRRRRHSVAALVVAGYLVAAVAVLLSRDALSLPQWLALHLVMLGAASNAVLVYSRHFAQALLHTPPEAEWRALARLGVFNAGVLAVVIGRSRDADAVAAVGAALVTVVVLAHVAALLGMLRRATSAGRLRAVAWYYVAGGLALAAGGTLGGVLVTGAHAARWHDALRLTHVHLNVFGWLGLAVIGTQSMLWPAVLRTRMPDWTPRVVRHVLGLTVGGLLVTVGGLLWTTSTSAGWWVAAFGMALYTAGVLYSLAPAAAEMRVKRPQSAAPWLLLAANGWLVVALVADVTRFATRGRDVAELPDLLLPALAVGLVVQVVTGALTFLLPVVLGGGPRGNRRLAAVLEYAWLPRVVAGNLGLLLVVAGASGDVLILGWTLVVVGFSSFAVLVAVAVVVAHRPIPAAPAAPPAPTSGRTSPVELVAVSCVAAVLAVVTLIGTGTWPQGTGNAAVAVAAASDVPVTVELDEFTITPAAVSVAPGTRLLLAVRNVGHHSHDLRLADGRGTRMLAPGEDQTLNLGVIERDENGWCTVAGHRQAGMTFAIRIDANPPAEAATMMPGHMMGMGSSAAPGPEWRPYDPTLQPVAGGTEHEVTLRVEERSVPIAPGVTQQVWTFGGTVPGPVLHGRIGDVFTVHLVNGGTIAHSIDFHASQVDPGTAMRSIAPGESLTYQFRAAHAGVWLYHCGTAPLIQHVAMGMYGAVIIDPADLAPVDAEDVLVQSEFYRGADGGIPELSALNAAVPDLVTFNGYANQYQYAPIRVKVGQRIRLWVLDAGPNLPSSFHVVGAQFDTVFKEGAYVLRPDPAVGGAAQALDLQPGQGGFVELVLTEPGSYPVVTHRLADAGRGAAGLLVAE